MAFDVRCTKPTVRQIKNTPKKMENRLPFRETIKL